VPNSDRDLWVAVLKDLVMTGGWFASLTSNRVLWAGREFQILLDGAMRELSAQSAQSHMV